MSHSQQQQICQNALREPLPVRERARAKVNLTLHVIGKRADGYHELESLVAFADVSDDVFFDPLSPEAMRLDGPFASAIDGENLVVKAKSAVSAWLRVDIPGGFTLRKNIPVAAGLGGGSSDAAAAIRALLRAYNAPAEARTNLAAQAAKIGADVPVCLHHGAAWMCGLGERVTPIRSFPSLPALLVNPGVKLSTRDVFKTLNASPCPSGGAKETAPFAAEWRGPEEAAAALLKGRNDLEPPAIALEPAVARVLDALRALDGCLLARLSGSGPTCFALFPSLDAAKAAEQRLRESEPGWWVASTTLS
jgi:4-diphosphocytidyl-2-C-methyl-D-erythritol kinase